MLEKLHYTGQVSVNKQLLSSLGPPYISPYHLNILCNLSNFLQLWELPEIFLSHKFKNLKKSTLATSCEELTHWKRLWCWEGLGAGGGGDDRGWDGWMASLTRWTWVWVNSGSWWWTGRPGVLWFVGSQSPTGLSDWSDLIYVTFSQHLDYYPNTIIIPIGKNILDSFLSVSHI